MRRGGIKVKHLTVDLNVPDVGGEILGQTPVCDCVSESVSEAYGPISPEVSYDIYDPSWFCRSCLDMFICVAVYFP